MNFASDEFFQYLKTEVMKEESDGQIYFELEKVIKKSVYGLIYRKVPHDSVDDVYQEVFFTVWRRLTDFLLKSENMKPAQRMSWLLTIVNRRIADYYEKQERFKEIASIDDENSNISMSDARSGIVEQEEFTKCMHDLFNTLLDMKTAPEKILGYVYSKLVLKSDGRNSGKPSIAVDYLTGKSLYDIFYCMKKDLQCSLGVVIPEYVFIPLKNKLDSIDKNGNLVGNRVFTYTVKKVTDGNNRIQKKLEDIECKELKR